MSHLVSPVSHRLGKVVPWHENNILDENQVLATRGITNLLKAMLRKRRLFVLRTVVSKNNTDKLIFKVLYLPRIKKRPKPSMFNVGYFKNLLGGYHQSLDRLNYNTLEKMDDYIDDHQDEDYEYTSLRRRRKPKIINQWLTLRMKKRANPKSIGLYYQPKNYNFRTNKFLQEILKTKLRLRKKLSRRIKWRYDARKTHKIKDVKLSTLLSRVFHKDIQIRTRNVWAYLAKKGLSKFRGHQEQFWHEAYRKYRWHYTNYYDIVNSISLIGLIKGSEHLFMQIISMVMPAIYEPYKIRRYFRFIDAVIKNNSQIQRQFTIFKLIITGKLAGGSKRTKSMAIGYGRLPVQTLSLETKTLTSSYTHTYGEFGMKLILCYNTKVSLSKLHKIRSLTKSNWKPKHLRFLKSKVFKRKKGKIKTKPTLIPANRLKLIGYRRFYLWKLLKKKNEWLKKSYKTKEQRLWRKAKREAKLKYFKTLRFKRILSLYRSFRRPFAPWNYSVEYPAFTDNHLRTLVDIATNERKFPGLRYTIKLRNHKLGLNSKNTYNNKNYYKNKFKPYNKFKNFYPRNNFKYYKKPNNFYKTKLPFKFKRNYVK